MLDLTTYSTTELADLFNRDPIVSNKRLLQGSILVEARTRFKFDWEFGRYIKQHESMSKLSVNYRGKLMQYARTFKDLDHTGISYSVASIISEPRYIEFSKYLYEFTHGNNLSIDEVRAEIRRLQGNPYQIEKDELSEHDYLEYRNLILPILEGLSEDTAIRILKSCKQAIKRNWKL